MQWASAYCNWFDNITANAFSFTEMCTLQVVARSNQIRYKQLSLYWEFMYLIFFSERHCDSDTWT